MDTKKFAKEIVEVIKCDIVESKKRRHKNVYKTGLELYHHIGCFSIAVNGREAYDEKLNKYEVKSLINEVMSLLNTLKKSRGWGLLNWTCTEHNIGEGFYDITYINVPTHIMLFSKPCKEFISLSNYIDKYCGKKIELTDIYGVSIGGKRGRVYGEEGSRQYLAYEPNRCIKYLEELRKSRGTKDLISTTISSRDEIDEWELECSIRNEVEFSGMRYNECTITIKTPNGKLKKTITIN